MGVFMKGINFADWLPFGAPPMRLPYDPSYTEPSLTKLAATGANWIALVVNVGQENVSSTKIFRSRPRTATNAELKYVVDLAHSLGLRVLLRPFITFSNDPEHLWTQIGTAFKSEDQWQQWFASYREMINFYAEFSQESGIDIFQIGYELGGVTHREADWRRIIGEVRARYKGLITYASLCSYPSINSSYFPMGEEKRIKWWDAVDYIGIDAYYPLTNKNDPTLEELKAGWEYWLPFLEDLSRQFKKPILFPEIGYDNKNGTNREPGGFRNVAPPDPQEQADCYQTALEALWGKPWFAGMFWWQWFANLDVFPSGPSDTGITPYGKPALEVLKKYYLLQPSTPASTPTPPPIPTQTRPLPPLDALMKGIYFNDWAPFDPSQLPPGAPPGAPLPPLKQGLYTPPEADQSLKNLAITGANWIAVSVRVGQETISSTKISRSANATATDAELRHVIDLAHSLGIRVLLMPLLHLSNDPTHGHIYIATTFNSETQWQEWFASYREFINSYATFAQEAGVDMFFIGNELGGTTHREADWRRVIQEVRQLYKGPITYDSLCGGFPFPMGEDVRIKWWDAVDYIGAGAYYPLTNKNNPTVAELKKAWTEKGYIDRLENLSKKFNKPVIISEIGYLSADGTNTEPANFLKFAQAPVDLQEQADCYQAAFEVLWGKPWLKGIFWFMWSSNPSIVRSGGPNDKSETPYGKPAEEVLKKYYLSQ